MANKEETDTKKETKATKKAPKNEWTKLDVGELRSELQKTYIAVKTGEETDTSKIKKIKREIARKLSQK